MFKKKNGKLWLSKLEKKDSHEQKHQWICTELTKGPNRLDVIKNETLTRLTFPTHRNHINQSENLASVKEKWPLLFHIKYLGIHFEILLGFSKSCVDKNLLTTGQAPLQVALDFQGQGKKKGAQNTQRGGLKGLTDVLSWVQRAND